MNTSFFSFLILSTIIACATKAQTVSQIKRIEFNSGTRGYREQIIITPDSVVAIQEDFKADKKPRVNARKSSTKEWRRILESLGDVRLSEIETLESPTMKRAYDGAAHGSIIITDSQGKTYTHGFDDEEPHARLQPLMNEIKRYRPNR